MRLFWRQRRVPQTASAWFALIRSGRIGSKLDQTWSSWMAADPDHQKTYEDQELAWELAAELRDRPGIQALLQDVDQVLRQHRAAGSKTRARGFRLYWQTGIAAVVMAVGVSTYFLMNRVSVSEYTTATGEQRVVTLADDSTATLNTGTRIRVLYSRAVRRVELLEGEALFSVSHDSARRFEVRALQGVTIAVGTQFDVQVEDADAAVSVLEGTVTVSANENVRRGETVSAGQAINYTRDGTASTIRPADTGRIRGWQAQRIVFSDVALTEALREYNRYIKVPIVLGNPSLATRRINGVFRIGDEDAFLGSLQQALHVKVSRTDAQTVLQTP
jgi:transmembrane sensor